MSNHVSSVAMKTAQADEPPVYLGSVEIRIADITNFGVGDEGATLAVRCIDGAGQPVVITIAADLAGILTAAIGKAQAQAETTRKAAGGKAIEQKLAVVTPQAYHVAQAADIDGVMLAFDPGTPSAQVFAFGFAAAMSIAQGLANAARAQAESKPRLIVPKT